MAMLSKGKQAIVLESDVAVQEEGMLSKSATNICICNFGPPLEEDGSNFVSNSTIASHLQNTQMFITWSTKVFNIMPELASY